MARPAGLVRDNGFGQQLGEKIAGSTQDHSMAGETSPRITRLRHNKIDWHDILTPKYNPCNLRLYFFLKTISRIKTSISSYPSLQTSVTSVKGIIPAGPPDRLPPPSSSCICGALGSPPEKLAGHPSCKPSFWKQT